MDIETTGNLRSHPVEPGTILARRSIAMKSSIHPLRISLTGVLVLALCFATGAALAQHDRERGREPYRGKGWELDHRFSHDHYYPSRGVVVAGVPPGSINVQFGNGRFFFHGGVWYRPQGPSFVVALPPIGVMIPVLPPAYVTLWFGGAPYYYANNVYYTPAPGGYVVATPPPGIENAAPPPSPTPTSPDLVVYPRTGQSPEQTALDRSACAQWATGQATGQPASVYMRAMSACMDGRGYTIR
jgi:hypothetical protein